MLVSILIVICSLLLTAVFSGGSGLSSLLLLVDPVSLLLLLAVVVPLLLCNGLWKDLCLAFKIACKGGEHTMLELKNALEAVDFTRRALLYASAMIVLFSAMLILAHCDQLEKLGPSVAVALLVLLYAAMLELFLLPVHTRIKKKLLSYMEGE